MFDADRIDWTEPIALFPLGGVSLLPHALQALHVFEPRYRQMTEDALGDGDPPDLSLAAPIAMATLAGRSSLLEYGGSPPLHQAVCVGRIVRHRRHPDGRHDIVLHGVARARILAMHEPEGERLYRMAELVPIERPGAPRPAMAQVRGAIRSILGRERLGRFAGVAELRELFGRTDIPTHAVLEIAAHALLHDGDLRYRMLAERDPMARAEIVRDALVDIERTVALAERQGSGDWPRGESWN